LKILILTKNAENSFLVEVRHALIHIYLVCVISYQLFNVKYKTKNLKEFSTFTLQVKIFIGKTFNGSLKNKTVQNTFVME